MELVNTQAFSHNVLELLWLNYYIDLYIEFLKNFSLKGERLKR